MPATILVTGYSQYAVNAFDMAAVDYLVKPFENERFCEALRRARRALATDGMSRLREHLAALLHPGSSRTSGDDVGSGCASGR